MVQFDQFEVLTFDCYGTLIDWETAPNVGGEITTGVE